MQEISAPVRSSYPVVFLDCANCDANYIRTQIKWVRYARDRTDADVHVLVTTQGTGAGGVEYTLTFLGQRDFESVDDTLRYATEPTATQGEVREALLHMLQLGLLRYTTASRVRDNLRVVYSPKNTIASDGTTEARSDPWHNWVFSASTSLSANGQQSTSSLSMSYSLSANRTTEAFKTSLAVSGSYGASRYKFDDTTSFTSSSRSASVAGGVVKSLTPHWSAGQLLTLSSSTFLNERSLARVAPAVEYDLFTYPEWSRRRLTVQYSVGVDQFQFYDTTLYGKIAETRGDQRLAISWGEMQPWGSVTVASEGAAYLQNFAQRHFSLSPQLNLRVARGVTLNVWGSLSLTRDQIYLSQQGLTAEEILVSQRQLASDYSYYMSVGLSYSFGSKFADVVNTRLGSIVGG